MPQYTPPPPTLDHLNPLQRYMQKGQLDTRDWVGLVALVIVYFVARPYIMKAAKWWFGDEKLKEGEKAQEDFEKRRIAAKIGANAIRSNKNQDGTTLEEIQNNHDVMTSGSKVDAVGGVVNRKNKPQTANNKPLEEQLLNWDDEPVITHIEGGEKTDVKQWLDKWDQ